MFSRTKILRNSLVALKIENKQKVDSVFGITGRITAKNKSINQFNPIKIGKPFTLSLSKI